MADIKEAIRRLIFQYTTEGADKVAAALKEIEQAAENTERSSLSLAKSFNAQERRYVSTVRHQQDYRRELEKAHKAFAQTPELQYRYERVLTGITEHYGKIAEAAQRAAVQQKKSIETVVARQTIVPDRAADIAAVGKQLQSLRDKYLPLNVAQREYTEALKELRGPAARAALSERERADAIQLTKGAFVQQVRSIQDADRHTRASTSGVRLQRHEMINLSRQIQDVGVSLASGQSAWMVAIQQGTQIADIAATAGVGLGTMFKQGIKGAASFIGPVWGTVAGVAAMGTAAVVATTNFASGQREVAQSLLGVGKASRATGGDINRIAKESADIFGFSINEAQEFASTLAATGRIGVEEIGKITALGKDVARIYGIDATEAAEKMAKAFSQPGKGAEELNKRLGSFNAAQLEEINLLEIQNRMQEAQAKLREGTKRGLEGVNATVSASTDLWTALGNAISDAWRKLGEGLGRATGVVKDSPIEALNKQLAETESRIAQVRDRLANMPASSARGQPGKTARADLEREEARLREINKQHKELTQKLEEQGNKTRENIESAKNLKLVYDALPLAKQLGEAEAAAKGLDDLLAKINATGGETSKILKEMGRSMQDVQLATQVQKELVKDLKDALEQLRIKPLTTIVPEVGGFQQAIQGLERMQELMQQKGTGSPLDLELGRMQEKLKEMGKDIDLFALGLQVAKERARDMADALQQLTIAPLTKIVPEIGGFQQAIQGLERMQELMQQKGTGSPLDLELGRMQEKLKEMGKDIDLFALGLQVAKERARDMADQLERMQGAPITSRIPQIAGFEQAIQNLDRINALMNQQGTGTPLDLAMQRIQGRIKEMGYEMNLFQVALEASQRQAVQLANELQKLRIEPVIGAVPEIGGFLDAITRLQNLRAPGPEMLAGIQQVQSELAKWAPQIDVYKLAIDAATSQVRQHAEQIVELSRRLEQEKNLRAQYPGFSLDTAKTLAALKDQEAVMGAVTGRQRIAAQYQATYNRLIREGKSHEEASAIANQERVNAIAAATAAIYQEVQALEDSTALIIARRNGTEAATAAQLAYNRAVRSGADEWAALALKEATYENVRQKNIKKAEPSILPGFSPEILRMLHTNEVKFIPDPSIFVLQGYYERTTEGFERMVDGLLKGNGSIPNVIDQFLRSPSNIYGRSKFTEEQAQIAQRLIDLLPEEQQASQIKKVLAEVQKQPISFAREELIHDLNEKLKNLTDSVDALNGALSPYYSQDPRTTKLGFRAGVKGNADWLVAGNKNALDAVLGPGATAPGGISAPGMAAGGSFVVGGGYSATDNRMARFPVASGEQVVVNRRPQDQRPIVVHNDNRIIIQGAVDQDTLSKMKVSRYQQTQRMRGAISAA